MSAVKIAGITLREPVYSNVQRAGAAPIGAVSLLEQLAYTMSDWARRGSPGWPAGLAATLVLVALCCRVAERSYASGWNDHFEHAHAAESGDWDDCRQTGPHPAEDVEA